MTLRDKAKRVAVLLLISLSAVAVLEGLALYTSSPVMADRNTTTTRHHSFCLTANGGSQTYTDDIMQRTPCGAVIFWNRDATDTVYINVNNDQVAATADCDDNVIVPPGMWVRLEVHRLKKMKYISDGTAEFYTSMISWEN